MEPGRPVSLPQRIWTVDIRNRPGPAAAVVCAGCGPLQHSPGQAVRAAALHHLARHARRDVTPPHLRTCQGGRLGCPWHGRTRGCSGPVLLALVRGTRASSWRLADLCHQCCIATPHAAPVPHHPPAAVAGRSRPAAAQEEAEEEQPVVWESACAACTAPDWTCRESCLAQRTQGETDRE